MNLKRRLIQLYLMYRLHLRTLLPNQIVNLYPLVLPQQSVQFQGYLLRCLKLANLVKYGNKNYGSYINRYNSTNASCTNCCRCCRKWPRYFDPFNRIVPDCPFCGFNYWIFILLVAVFESLV